MTKRCTRCQQEKPVLTGFTVSSQDKSGFHAACRECRNEWKRNRPAEKKREERRLYRERNREKFRVHKAVAKAVARGTLVRPEACEGCGSVGPVQAHHEDYEKRFEVVWLCSHCHGLRHSEDFECAA